MYDIIDMTEDQEQAKREMVLANLHTIQAKLIWFVIYNFNPM